MNERSSINGAGSIALITNYDYALGHKYWGSDLEIEEMIIIIIAPLTIVKEDQWGDLECLHKACAQQLKLMEAYS